MAPRGEVVPTSPHPLRANSQLEHEVQLVATGAQRLRPFINYFHKILKWKGNENTISFIFYTVSLWIIFYGVHWILFGKKEWPCKYCSGARHVIMVNGSITLCSATKNLFNRHLKTKRFHFLSQQMIDCVCCLVCIVSVVRGYLNAKYYLCQARAVNNRGCPNF